MEIVNRVGIRENGEIWEFINEVALEDFLWDNLEVLFDLIPLKRQLNINGQICDILALDRDRGLVILELKNTEDRYILQQLTRYYDAVIRSKPFPDQIDYARSIRLVAIKPQFHRDNYTDRQYSKLYFEFWQFSIIESNRSLFFHLINVDNQEIKQLKIPYELKVKNENIPTLPANLSRILAKCPLEQQQEILRIREKILTFDKRMQEVATAGSIKYGDGNTRSSKFCAEFYIDKGKILIFLWLPLKSSTGEKISRHRLWTDWNGKTLVEGYANSGIGTNINAHDRIVDNLVNKLNGKRDDSRGYHRRFRAYYIDSRHNGAKLWTGLNNRSLVFSSADERDIIIGLNASAADIEKYIKISKSVAKRIRESNLFTIITPKEIELINTVVTFEEQKEKKIFLWDVDIQSVYKSLDYFIDIALERWLSRI